MLTLNKYTVLTENKNHTAWKVENFVLFSSFLLLTSSLEDNLSDHTCPEKVGRARIYRGSYNKGSGNIKRWIKTGYLKEFSTFHVWKMQEPGSLKIISLMCSYYREPVSWLSHPEFLRVHHCRWLQPLRACQQGQPHLSPSWVPSGFTFKVVESFDGSILGLPIWQATFFIQNCQIFL